MNRYDALPPELRRWMAQAVLPWSPTSCLRIWRRALAEDQDVGKAWASLKAAESNMLARQRSGIKGLGSTDVRSS